MAALTVDRVDDVICKKRYFLSGGDGYEEANCEFRNCDWLVKHSYAAEQCITPIKPIGVMFANTNAKISDINSVCKCNFIPRRCSPKANAELIE